MLQRLKEKDHRTEVVVKSSSTNGKTYDDIANPSLNSVLTNQQHRHFPRQMSGKIPKETAVKLGLYDSNQKY